VLNREYLTDELAGVIAASIIPEIRKQMREAMGHRLWSEMIHATAPLERKFTAVMRKYFREQMAVVRANMKKMPKAYRRKDAVDFWSFGRREWDERLRKEGTAFMKEVTEREGPRIMQQLHHMVPDAEGRMAGVGFDVTNPNVSKYLDERSFKFAGGVNDTTFNDLRRELAEGMNAGEGMRELAARVSMLEENYAQYRSMMVARSETIRTANAAAEMSYVQSGVIEKKEWWAAGDERSCGHCMELHGQVVEVNTNFRNLGEEVAWKPSEAIEDLMA